MQIKTILQTGDPHLDYTQFQLTQRKLDYYAAMFQIADIAIEREVDAVLLTGDLFQTPRPSTPSIACALKWKNKLKKAGIDVIAISGNHEIADPPWIDVLGMQNIARTPYEVDNGAIMQGLPYSTSQVVVQWLEESVVDETLYMVLHQTYEGIAPHPSALDFRLEDVPNNMIILCGHIHQQYIYSDPEKQSTICYAGNTEYWRMGEDLTKSVCIWSEDGHEVVPIKTRPVIDFTLEDDEEDLFTAIASADQLPIVILRYSAGVNKRVIELSKELKNKVLVLKKVPQKEQSTSQIRADPHKKQSPIEFVDGYLKPGTVPNTLARTLLNSPDTVDSALAGFREKYLGVV